MVQSISAKSDPRMWQWRENSQPIRTSRRRDPCRSLPRTRRQMRGSTGSRDDMQKARAFLSPSFGPPATGPWGTVVCGCATSEIGRASCRERAGSEGLAGADEEKERDGEAGDEVMRVDQ